MESLQFLYLSFFITIGSFIGGFILSWIGCYKGFYTRGGAKGVGIATTQSVVIACIMILIANYFLTTILF